MKKKLSWHFWLVCGVIAVIAVLMSIHFSRKTEYACEMADLQTMRSAEAVAALMWRDKLPEDPAEYWFDSRTMQLIPTSEPMPEPYGAGTKRNGYAEKDFQDQADASYDYSGREDYTDRVLHVFVSSQDGRLNIAIDWVAGR